MAYTYTVSTGPSATGPWTPFGSPVSGVTDTITGLSAGTTYFVQIITTDTTSGLTSVPVVAGPYTTTAAGPVESPNGTIITAANQSILASQTPGSPAGASLDTWTVVGGVALINGADAGFTTGILELAYYNHTVYQESTSTNNLNLNPGWWQWSGSTWVDCASPVPVGPAISIATIPSQNTNTAFTVSGTMTGYTAVPTLQYQDNQTGSWINLPTQPTTTSAFSFSHPGVATANAAMTVGIWDAVTHTIVALSNTFSVSVPGVVTITGITLSSSSFTGGVASGTVVGAITPVTVGGAFTGTLSLTGTNASLFQIVGKNLETNGVVAAGSYNINIVATQSGASGSPFTAAETITGSSGPAVGPVVSGSFVNADFSSLTSKTVSQYMWGFSGGGLCYGGVPPNGQNDFGASQSTCVFDPLFQASAAIVKPQLIRLNCQQTIPMLQHIFANGVGSPDWTYLNNWINNHSGFFSDTTGRLVFGIGPNGTDTSISASTYASWATTVANYLKSKGQECFYYEVGNECDGIGTGNYVNYFNAIADALHLVNPNYKIGGPVSSYWDNGGNGAAILSSSTGVVNGAQRLGYIVFHNYGFGSGGQSSSAIYSQAIGEAGQSSVRSAMQSAGVGNLPICRGEYNMCLYGDNSIFDGAMFVALMLLTAYQSDSNFTMGSIWDLTESGGYASIGNANVGDNSHISPQGYYLGKSGQIMAGTEATAASPGSGNFLTLATKTGSHFALQIVNQGSNASGQVALSHWPVNANGNGTINRWELSNANPAGNLTTLTVTGGMVASTTIPGPGVVILYA